MMWLMVAVGHLSDGVTEVFKHAIILIQDDIFPEQKVHFGNSHNKNQSIFLHCNTLPD